MTAKRYVNCIVRKIKCSKKERLEIKNQLHSDIAIAMEQGEAFEDIMNRMGSVSEVAAEFNSNLSKAEQKKYKRVVAWKIVLVTVAAVIGILGVFAWWYQMVMTALLFTLLRFTARMISFVSYRR